MEISQPAEHPKVHVQTEDLTMENSSSFKHDELTSTCGIHTIILDCSSWSFVDTVGLDALKSVIMFVPVEITIALEGKGNICKGRYRKKCFNNSSESGSALIRKKAML